MPVMWVAAAHTPRRREAGYIARSRTIANALALVCGDSCVRTNDMAFQWLNKADWVT